MVKQFLDENFLLNSKTAQKLYYEYAEKLPIIDYHCHLNPKEIYENNKFTNITELWLGKGATGDHYKWRLMRAYGIDEKYITGDSSPYDKFLKWAEVIPFAIGNPLLHWSMLELQRYFNIHEVLTPKNAKTIYDTCNSLLQSDEFTPRRLLERSKVEIVCTTDDPIDTLEYHQKLKNEYNKIKVLPTFRPDRVIYIERTGYCDYINKLSDITGIKITNHTNLEQALINRLDYFERNGCKLSDHSLETVMYADYCELEIDEILTKALNGNRLTDEEVAKYKTYIMVFLGKEYAKRNWVMQLHMAAFRNVNTKKYIELGPDTGFDVINVNVNIHNLQRFLDKLEQQDSLPKTILYSLNPNDFDILATLMGSFQDGKIPLKMQLGSAWWFNDHIDGMTKQIKTLANVGLLSKFVGMLTDSRSFLSYVRHEYFRRLLCNIIGEWVEHGLYPNDEDLLKKIIEDICYYNAKTYFAF